MHMHELYGCHWVVLGCVRFSPSLSAQTLSLSLFMHAHAFTACEYACIMHACILVCIYIYIYTYQLHALYACIYIVHACMRMMHACIMHACIQYAHVTWRCTWPRSCQAQWPPRRPPARAPMAAMSKIMPMPGLGPGDLHMIACICMYMHAYVCICM